MTRSNRTDPPRGNEGDSAPGFEGVLETVLYYDEDREAEIARFYGETLGLRPIGRKRGQFLFFRAGHGVLLLFNAEESRRQASPPAHGASGPGHVCFLSAPGRYEQWKARLGDAGVDLEEESEWPRGGRSFYFRDPAGNALEIADRDIWGA